MRKRRNPVVFVVTFADGTTSRIGIDSAKLLRGDQAAYTVAAERKQAGLLPDKQIKSIRRVQRQLLVSANVLGHQKVVRHGYNWLRVESRGFSDRYLNSQVPICCHSLPG